MLRRGKEIKSFVKGINNIKPSMKDVDKAYQKISDSILLLKKFQSALKVNRLNKKVLEEVKVDIETLIARAEKLQNNVADYSAKIIHIKEQ